MDQSQEFPTNFDYKITSMCSQFEVICLHSVNYKICTGSNINMNGNSLRNVGTRNAETGQR